MYQIIMRLLHLSIKKAGLITNTGADSTNNEVKIALPLKYLSNLWRSLEVWLINWIVELSLK